jgi:hypothetical protein
MLLDNPRQGCATMRAQMFLVGCGDNLCQWNTVSPAAEMAFCTVHPMQRRDLRGEIKRFVMPARVVPPIFDVSQVEVTRHVPEYRHCFQPATYIRYVHGSLATLKMAVARIFW